MAEVLRKWRTESQRTILRAGRIIDLSSTVHPNPIQPNPLNISPHLLHPHVCATIIPAVGLKIHLMIT